MLKSELIKRLIEHVSAKYPEMTEKAIIESSQAIIKAIIDTLKEGGRMEIRGFGSFDLYYHAPRKARNPQNGKTITMSGRYRAHFKAAKKLRLRLNASYR